MTKKLTKTIGYLRVSTDKQADHGQSLAAQRDQIHAYAKLYEMEIVRIVEDRGVSAKTLERAGLQEALAALEAGEATAVLVSKLDRLTRSVVDLGHLLHDVFATHELVSVAEQIDTRSAAGRFMLNILASVSQWEREAIGERTQAVMSSMKARGQRVGSLPYGSRLAADGKTLEPDPTERKILTRIRADVDAGHSLRTIARALQSDGVPARSKHGSKKPGKWSHATVMRMLKCAA